MSKRTWEEKNMREQLIQYEPELSKPNRDDLSTASP